MGGRGSCKARQALVKTIFFSKYENVIYKKISNLILNPPVDASVQSRRSKLPLKLIV